MAHRAFFIAANVTLAVVLLQAFALAQETRDGLSTADPAQEGFSVQRLGETEKAIQNGDFKQVTRVLISRHGRSERTCLPGGCTEPVKTKSWRFRIRK